MANGSVGGAGEGAGPRQVLAPVRFVRERNPSLGWPSWSALDVVLVDFGPKDQSQIDELNHADPTFEEPLEIVGELTRLSSAEGKRRWDGLLDSRAEADPPLGTGLLPAVLALVVQHPASHDTLGK
ncbi:MAG: hypothetical protein R3B07_19715 [Polyangiaceae bacterium]